MHLTHPVFLSPSPFNVFLKMRSSRLSCFRLSSSIEATEVAERSAAVQKYPRFAANDSSNEKAIVVSDKYY